MHAPAPSKSRRTFSLSDPFPFVCLGCKRSERLVDSCLSGLCSKMLLLLRTSQGVPSKTRYISSVAIAVVCVIIRGTLHPLKNNTLFVAHELLAGTPTSTHTHQNHRRAHLTTTLHCTPATALEIKAEPAAIWDPLSANLDPSYIRGCLVGELFFLWMEISGVSTTHWFNPRVHARIVDCSLLDGHHQPCARATKPVAVDPSRKI